MCGISGIVGPVSDRGALVERMTAAIAHRGPDDVGAYTDEHCSLGHRRLAIIDLSTAGHQPMTNEDGTIQLVFNGEIYNFQELRQDLVARGHTFRSRTDSEVLVHLYEERGEAMVAALRGMFAIALWDARRKRVLLARDHFGQKPIFYALHDGALYFASEIKALIAGGIPSRPDPVAIDQLLRVQCVTSPRSCFEAIRRLPPATLAVYEPGGELEVRRYWNLDGVVPQRMAMEDAVDEAAMLCRAAVTEQLVADVPVGVFFSGGIDSSIVLAASAVDGRRPQSFTLGYEEEAYSEVAAARRAAAGQSTDHHVVLMRASDAARPEELVAMFDEPFPDVAALPLAHLSRAARRHVKVALTGDGGDELFGGYEHHIAGFWLDKLSPFDRLRALSAGLLLRAARLAGPRVDRARRVLGPLSAPSWRDAVTSMRTAVSDGLRDDLYAPELLKATRGASPADALFGDDGGLFTAAGDRFLADRLLMKTDLATMAVGLESRCPMLDLRLAELAAGLAPELKVAGLEGKQVLRRVLARSAPPVVWQRPKRGFSMPLDQWLKAELAGVMRDTLLAPNARIGAYLRPSVLARMYREHCAGAANWRRVLWTALLLELWLRRYVR